MSEPSRPWLSAWVLSAVNPLTMGATISDTAAPSDVSMIGRLIRSNSETPNSSSSFFKMAGYRRLGETLNDCCLRYASEARYMIEANDMLSLHWVWTLFLEVLIAMIYITIRNVNNA